jgi:hypothetical protein
METLTASVAENALGLAFQHISGVVRGMTNVDKVRENRLRRTAQRQGLQLKRSRRRDELAVDYGVYGLVRPTRRASSPSAIARSRWPRSTRCSGRPGLNNKRATGAPNTDGSITGRPHHRKTPSCSGRWRTLGQVLKSCGDLERTASGPPSTTFSK